MAQTSLVSLTLFKLNCNVPLIVEGQAPSPEERSLCTATYKYKLAQVPTQLQKVGICLSPATAVSFDANSGKVGELCLTPEGGAYNRYGDYNHFKVAFKPSSNTEDPTYDLAPRLVAVATCNHGNGERVEALGNYEWGVRAQRYCPQSWELEMSVEFQSSCLLGFASLSSTPNVVNPALKVSLLETGETTGDLNLLSKDGSKVPAHSAVLVSVPYFATKLKSWSRSAWNLNNKLDLELPNPVPKKVLETFLKYVYGDLGALRHVDSSDASFMQELFSTADACGVLPLCSDVDRLAQVTPTTAYSWLEWLSHEHGGDTSKLHEKVRSVVKLKFTDASFWDDLGADKLLALETVVKKST